jgi:hypothetical protein
MTQDDVPEPSLLEQKIQKLLDGHPQLGLLNHMSKEIKQTINDMANRGAAQEMLAVAACTNLAGMLAAQKMLGIVKPDLIHALIDDLADTVKNRTIVGVLNLHTKQ